MQAFLSPASPSARASPRIFSVPGNPGLASSPAQPPSRNYLIPVPKPFASIGIRLVPKSSKIITSTMIR